MGTSVVESLFSKVKETFAFGNSVEKANTCMDVPKGSFRNFETLEILEISRSPLLTGVAGLQDKVCNATKNGKFSGSDL